MSPENMPVETQVELDNTTPTPDTWAVNQTALEKTLRLAAAEKLQRQPLRPVPQFKPDEELAPVKDSFARHDKRKGKLVARLSAAINGSHHSENLKYRTLAELGNPLNGFNYGGEEVFDNVVSQLKSQRARRAPLAASLARGMEPQLMQSFQRFLISAR